jgi:protein-arginine kinase activator protein McsA
MDTISPTTVKEALGILEDGMTQAKAIKLQEKTKLPADLSKPNAELDSYLATLRQACTEEEEHMNRYRRMRNTRLTKTNAVEVQVDEKKVVVCNDTSEDSSIIVQKRIGYRLTCPRCNYSWSWFGKKDRFFVSCSRCHKSFRLNWR